MLSKFLFISLIAVICIEKLRLQLERFNVAFATSLFDSYYLITHIIQHYTYTLYWHIMHYVYKMVYKLHLLYSVLLLFFLFL